MKQPIVIIGVGEMGGVFARGFLRLGHPVYPVTRGQNLEQAATEIPEPEAVLVAVGEKDLPGILEQLPDAWKNKIILLQNELLPADFSHLPEVTVISVWFEKKPGMDYKVIIPSPCYGPRCPLLRDALGKLDIPVKILGDEDQLLFELVLKNLYILTTNIAGLKTGGSVGELWAEHQDIALEVAEDVIRLQEKLTGRRFDHEALIAAMLHAFEGDPEHKCMGRSAPARLERALEHARDHELELPSLMQLASEMH
ncbi:ketopantoate reductase family protein [Thiolapillus sp.]